jgi:hypothetical protein
LKAIQRTATQKTDLRLFLEVKAVKPQSEKQGQTLK